SSHSNLSGFRNNFLLGLICSIVEEYRIKWDGKWDGISTMIKKQKTNRSEHGSSSQLALLLQFILKYLSFRQLEASDGETVYSPLPYPSHDRPNHSPVFPTPQ